ncbi:hypothetical protein [Loigolactobacillus backii]|nr:hypothetical protein [Loigolactobacillus backii]
MTDYPSPWHKFGQMFYLDYPSFDQLIKIPATIAELETNGEIPG